MNKRYQVFVSSTYADLKDERSRVLQTLMEMDCIPSGMELFPASDEEQFEFIKKIIDDCDYYLLIIGGRYGSTTNEGISYTEKEYLYAISKGLKVIAFLHQDPDAIPVGKTDKNPELAARLDEFRQKVQTNRLIKFWKSAEELPGLVSLSLTKTMKTYPAVGWIRGNSTATPEILEELNSLRKLNEELRENISKAISQVQEPITNMAGLQQQFDLKGTYTATYGGQVYNWVSTITFGEIFALIAPYLMENPADSLVKLQLIKLLLSKQGKKASSSDIDQNLYQTVKLQFKALGLVNLDLLETTKGGRALFWSLTKAGERTMTELRVIRAS